MFTKLFNAVHAVTNGLQALADTLNAVATDLRSRAGLPDAEEGPVIVNGEAESRKLPARRK